MSGSDPSYYTLCVEFPAFVGDIAFAVLVAILQAMLLCLFWLLLWSVGNT